MKRLTALRQSIRDAQLTEESEALRALVDASGPTLEIRNRIQVRATRLVEDIRKSGQPGLMEVVLAEYGLSTTEGIALMCLAEALLRVPDAETIDALIEDKIAPSSWSEHLGQSNSPFVNASTWALMITGTVLQDTPSQGFAGVMRGAVKRLGEPIIRAAVKRAMKELGRQFVLGRTIEEAIERGAPQEQAGFSYSYDMLGEAALTETDAQEFLRSYEHAIGELGRKSTSAGVRDNPGISIKLSALHPRYEVAQRSRVLGEIVARSKTLALRARAANIGLNIDAEEADRLDLSLDVIEALLRDPELAGWDGFGVVVQAYGKRCPHVLDWLYELSHELDRKLMVRLVKGAYWDTEIKRSQVEGLEDFPVFSQKAATDVSFICCTQKLFAMTDRIYPQFATHNAHTAAAVLELASDIHSFEFQRLHGMGEALHATILDQEGSRCRIYAPVGAHRDLLAYLVRRLLENGANSSFVNQIVDESVSAEEVATDPFAALAGKPPTHRMAIRKPGELYAPVRANSRGWDVTDNNDIADIESARAGFREFQWHAGPMIAGDITGDKQKPLLNPAAPDDVVGSVLHAAPQDVETALAAARPWSDCAAADRSEVLQEASRLYEENFGEIFAVLCREAGKTPTDAIAEMREAVDFLRYYASEAERHRDRDPCGVIGCISPWNFPLAIFTGQIAAALAAGNAVLAKPADPTPLVASIAVRLLHQAGVPRPALQLLPGRGSVVGAALTTDPRVNGICFTGSTATAQTVNAAMAENLQPHAQLIAETGGLNAMIVDSTALPEQAVRDIIVSAFQSAGQRCSALRILCLQEDVAPAFLEMLFGAMDELVVGSPWDFSTDVGPVIDANSRSEITAYVDAARREGRLLKQRDAPRDGHFIAPAVIEIGGIPDLDREIFGPVLHVATFRSQDVDRIVDDINASGYGLTFGLHSRIDDRVEKITSRLRVGNMYINRNQIGAVVGSQPFGGEGLSGTGPKAGGPHYVARFTKGNECRNPVSIAPPVDRKIVQAALSALPPVANRRLVSFDLPGPTGESNRLSLYPRGVVLCLGPSPADANQQAELAAGQGCAALAVVPGAQGENAISGFLERADLTALQAIDAVALWSDTEDLRAARMALAARPGPLIPLISVANVDERCVLERHVCIDTTAAGGNASLLAASA